MTSEKATDLSDAAGTLWVDVAKRKWSPEMLAATGLTEAHMPRLCEGRTSPASCAQNSPRLGEWTAFPSSPGGGDNAAGAAGVGVIDQGDAFLSLGTSGVLFLAGNAYRPNPERAVHAFCHCLPKTLAPDDRHPQRRELRRLGGAASPASKPANSLRASKSAAASTAPKSPPLPFGRAHAPQRPARARRSFRPQPRLGRGRRRRGGARRRRLRICRRARRPPRSRRHGRPNLGHRRRRALAMVGPRSRRRLGRALVYRDGSEVGPAYGAARLARIGVTGESPEDVCTPPPVRTVIEPNQHDVDRLAVKRQSVREALSGAPRPLPHRLTYERARKRQDPIGAQRGVRDAAGGDQSSGS